MNPEKQHKFERAGLGKAPFRVVGYSEERFTIPGTGVTRPGASCDYCGTAIVDAFWVVGSDGKRFKVGSDCVRKSGDSGLTRAVTEQERETKRKRAEERIERIYARAKLGEFDEALSRLPHPKGWEGKTALDWAQWTMRNAGQTGRIQVCRFLEKLCGTVPEAG